MSHEGFKRIPGIEHIIETENYKNAFRVSVGGSYQYNPEWRFKLGIMYDQTPIRDANRKIYLPQEDIISPTLGFQYKICESLALDFAYAHVFFKNAPIQQSAPLVIPASQQTFESLQGNVKQSMEVFGLQLTWDFG